MLVAGEAVPGGLGAQDQQAPAGGGPFDPPRRAQLRRQERRAVPRVGVVDAEQVAPAPHFRRQLLAFQGGFQLPAQRGPSGRRVINPAFALQDVDHRQTHRARQGRPVPGVADGVGNPSRGDGFVHMPGVEDRPDGRIPRSQPLGQGDHVRRAGQAFGREPGAGPAHPGHHLVEADQEPVPLPPLGQPLPEPGGRRVGGQGGGADRLAEESRNVLRAGLLQGLVEGVERLLAGGVETPGGGGDVSVAAQIRAEGAVQPRPSGQRQGGHGGTVVGLGRGDDLPPPPLSPGGVVGAGGPDHGFVGFRAPGYETHPRQAGRSQRGQLGGQCFLPGVGEPFVVQAGDAAGLLPGGFDQVAAAVAQAGGHGTAAHSVQVALARGILHPGALTGGDDPVRPGQLEMEHGCFAGGDKRRLHLLSTSSI